MSIIDRCWIYPSPNANGYGRHREAYEAIKGPIPDKMDLDHVCHNRDETCAGGRTCIHRSCYNPWHLVPKSRSENLRAGRTFAAATMAKVSASNKAFYSQPGVRDALREPGRRDAVRRWAAEDRSPIVCSTCGRGPFKGPFGLKQHLNQYCSGKG